MAQHEAHRPHVYIGGVEVVGHWIGEFEVDTEEIMHYCETEVDDTRMWDLCMRMAICIEEYQQWWDRVRKENGYDNRD